MKPLPRTVVALGVVSLLMDFSSELVHGLLPIYLTATLGVSMVALGWIEGVAEATAQIVKVFSGSISDRMGKRKPLLLIGYGIAILTRPMFPLASGAGLVFFARFADRVGKGIRGAPRDALVADVTPPEQRGAAFGLRQSLDTIGGVFGPLTAAALLAGVFGVAIGIREALWWAVVPSILAWLVLLAIVREPEAPATTSGKRIRMSDVRNFSGTYWLVVGLGTVFTLARFSEAFLVLRVAQFAVDAWWGPLTLALMAVVYAISSYPAGLLADRIDTRVLLALGLVVLIAADTMLALATTTSTALVGVALWGLHMGLTQGVLAAMVAGTAPPDFRGSAFGVFNLITGVTLLLASVVAGALWQYVSPIATFAAGAILCGATLIGLVRVPVLRPGSTPLR